MSAPKSCVLCGSRDHDSNVCPNMATVAAPDAQLPTRPEWWAVYDEQGQPQAAYPRKHQAEVYATGFSKPMVVKPLYVAAQRPNDEREAARSFLALGASNAAAIREYLTPEEQVRASELLRGLTAPSEAETAPTDEEVDAASQLYEANLVAAFEKGDVVFDRKEALRPILAAFWRSRSGLPHDVTNGEKA